ncbi:MAG: hypothetical protein E6G27_03425 [Actinobacteria bacterium]|nr:MAG: hypothetical protein E6G27_03425 [Actinomycetota bacterium]
MAARDLDEATTQRDPAQQRVGLSINITFHLPSASMFARAAEVRSRESHLGFFASLRQASKSRKKVTLSVREDRIAALLASWIVFGLFLDGWNHLNLQEGKLGPWLTPWHYNLYAGFTATMLWIVSRWRRCRKQGTTASGYGLGIVGIGVATFGVAGDALWHTMFGVEVGITRVISPFHLVLMAGGFLLAATALRSGWHSNRPARATMGEFFPVLLSATLITAMVAYFFQELSPFLTWIPAGLVKLSAQSPFNETTQIYLVASILISNLIFMAPVSLLLRRWQPPFGSLTFLFTFIAAGLATQTEGSRGMLVGAALVGGLVGDMAIRRFNPTPTTIAANRMVSTIIPMAFWGTHFAVLWAAYKIIWVPELWVASILLSMGTGFMLSLLTLPSPVPVGVWQELPLASGQDADAQGGEGADDSEDAEDPEEDDGDDEVIDLRERAPKGRAGRPVPVVATRERPRSPRVEPGRRQSRTAAAQRQLRTASAQRQLRTASPARPGQRRAA